MERWYPPAEGKWDQGFFKFQYGSDGQQQGFNYRIYGKGLTLRGPAFHPDHQQFDDWRMGHTGFRTDWDAHNRGPANASRRHSIWRPPGQRVQIASTLRPLDRCDHETRAFGEAICSVAGSAM